MTSLENFDALYQDINQLEGNVARAQEAKQRAQQQLASVQQLQTTETLAFTKVQREHSTAVAHLESLKGSFVQASRDLRTQMEEQDRLVKLLGQVRKQIATINHNYVDNLHGISAQLHAIGTASNQIVRGNGRFNPKAHFGLQQGRL
eukprot:m.109532 g.109532  ORF g.109532 m.109532 type:complete len:147 (+) comp15986_c0_seq3:368-808(+)